MDLTANTLLSASASPTMLYSIEAISDFTFDAHAICVNIGTLSSNWLPAMKSAVKLSSTENIANLATAVRFYSLKFHSYVHTLRFRSIANMLKKLASKVLRVLSLGLGLEEVHKDRVDANE